MKRSCITALLAFSLAGVAASAGSPIGLQAIEQFERISELRQGVRAYQHSSHDPGGRNQDWAGHLAMEGNERVLLDVKGPGCIYRIWLTGHDINAYFRVYFDDETTPTVNMKIADFFSGNHTPFLSPLVGNNTVSSGGFYCYLPMTFRQRCKIVSTSTTDRNYYCITYHRFDSTEGVTTFTGQESTVAARAMWNAAGTDPKPDHGSAVITQTAAIPANSSVQIASVPSPGIIQQIELSIPDLSQSVLASVRIQAWWDGTTAAAVDAPLGSFFGSGLQPATVNALPVGMSENRLYCFFPMPFRSSAALSLTNTGGADVPAATWTIRYTPLAVPPDGVGLFHARHRRAVHQTIDRDYVFLDETGAGHLVGIVQTLRGYNTDKQFLEGDERIYIDGMATPAIYGTGTEDFYNGGWYFDQGPFTLPVHGNPASRNSPTAAYTCYRFFLSDAIPFTQSVLAGIEHGAWNTFDVDIESVAMYYKTDRPLGRLTAQLEIGDAASESKYGYQVTGTSATDTQSLTYEGDQDHITVTDTGRRLGSGSYSRFVVPLHPKNNAGLLLRRRLDYSLPRQQAQVRVDGTPIGIWYDAGSNTRFADSEFMIPAPYTDGKSSVTVEVQNVSTESDWTEYRYLGYTLTQTASYARADFDQDGDVDQEDFGHLQMCLTGSFGFQQELLCQDTMFDADPDVDQQDFTVFLACLSGAGVPADPQCGD